jgi:hypothetical protein
MSDSAVGLARSAFIGLGFVVGLFVCALMADFDGIVLYVAYAGVGSYLAIRRPRNSIGWLLVVTGWALGAGSTRITQALLETLAAATPWDAIRIWVSGCLWAVAFVALLAITLVFPSGHLPIGGGRRPSQVALGAATMLALLLAVTPTINLNVDTGQAQLVPNPFTLFPDEAAWPAVLSTNVLYTLLGVVFALGVGSLLVRFRRSSGIARLQFRWLVASLALVIAGTIAWVVLAVVVSWTGPSLFFVLATYPAVPIAITIAVLRYRLFEVDRVISRTLAYAGVTATLALVFVAGVLGLQALLEQFVGGNTIAVAASTLVVAALFQPLRRRVQAVVDRRFNRARYDAQRTVEAFTAQLRDETDLGAVTEDLSSTVGRALEPHTSWIWVRRRGADS